MPRRTLVSLLELEPNPWRWSVGIHTACAIFFTSLFWWFLGRKEYGFIASMGAFSAFYGTTLHRIDRCKLLLWISAGMLAASAMGSAFAGHPVLQYAMVFLVVVISSLLTLGFSVGPPGPMMFALVAAASAYLATPRALGGPGRSTGEILVLLASGMAVAWLTVAVPLLFPSQRKREGPPLPLKELLPFSVDREVRVQTIRLAVGVLIGMLLFQPLEVYRPQWLIITILGVLQAGSGRYLTTVRAIQRVLGTILGLGLYKAITLFSLSWLELIVVISLLQGLSKVVIVRNYGLGLFFITPLVLIIYTASLGGDPAETMHGRVHDTVIGAVIAMAVLLGSELVASVMQKSSRS